MRYYVEINGVSSLTIQGLAISELPSISKPLIRTQREEIDGRDGDIITKLGYSAYDKTLKIGLWGNYNINEVIAFFNTDGKITFSNEPDKYYYFTILNRADFINQLEAFRTATITIHCQPFKYMEQESPEFEREYIEKSGTSITWDNSLEAPLEIDLKGNTSQTGTPTPSSPIPVNVVSGDNDIVVSDGGTDTTTYNIDLPVENLLENTLTSREINNLTIVVNEDKTISINGTANAETTLTIGNIATLKANTYSLSGTPSTGGSSTYKMQLTGAGSTRNETGSGLTFTTKTDYSNVAVVLKIYNGVQVNNLTFKPQLEIGSKINRYTPYGTTPIELNKIGTYQDYIYKENDKWYLHKEVGKIDMATITGWQGGNSQFYKTGFVGTYGIKEETCLSNIFLYSSTAWYGDDYFGITSTNNLWFRTSDSTLTDANNVPTWLSNKGAIMYGILATPTNTEITYTPLIEQLNTLEQAQSKEGTTNINQVNNDLPFMITASVLCGTANLIVNNLGNIIAKPVMTITGSGDIGVYLNGSQIFNIALGDEEYITIDIPNMEAHKDDTLKNRLVVGDYNSFVLQPGENTISFTGDVSNFDITNYSRWI